MIELEKLTPEKRFAVDRWLATEPGSDWFQGRTVHIARLSSCRLGRSNKNPETDARVIGGLGQPLRVRCRGFFGRSRRHAAKSSQVATNWTAWKHFL